MYTSYYARCKKLDASGVPYVAISLWPPRWYTGPSYPVLAPTRAILTACKAGEIDDAEYVVRYHRDVLAHLDPKAVYDDLVEKFGQDVAILCFEKPGDFCHRHLVALWFEQHLGVEVPEWSP